MEEENTAKDFAIDKAKEIISITMDLKFARNRFLLHKGCEEIERLAVGILEHLEYLELKKVEEE